LFVSFVFKKTLKKCKNFIEKKRKFHWKKKEKYSDSDLSKCYYLSKSQIFELLLYLQFHKPLVSKNRIHFVSIKKKQTKMKARQIEIDFGWHQESITFGILVLKTLKSFSILSLVLENDSSQKKEIKWNQSAFFSRICWNSLHQKLILILQCQCNLDKLDVLLNIIFFLCFFENPRQTEWKFPEFCVFF